MKLLLPLAACAALAGCVSYGDPYGAVYPSSGYYYGNAPGYVTNGAYVTPGYVYGTNGVYNNGRGMRDRDRDGIPNRLDNDRDNDGVPNQYDSRPNNPRRH
jgi:hypothetical protein